MTNNQIISMYCTAHGITEELHTFQRWQQLGYSVKKGEKARHRITIWKHGERKRKNPETGELETVEGDATFMKQSCFFLASQVEPTREQKAAGVC